MNMMKKVVAILAVMTMALGLFTACGKDQSKDLQGNWKLKYDLGDLIAEEMSSAAPDFNTPFEVKFIFSFAEDGTAKLYLDSEYAEQSLESWKKALADYMMQTFYSEGEQNGLDKAQTDALIQDTYGKTVEEYVNETIATGFDAVDITDLLDDASATGKFTAKNNVLTIVSDEGTSIYNFELKDNSLTLSLPEGSEESDEIYERISFPVTFTKTK